MPLVNTPNLINYVPFPLYPPPLPDPILFNNQHLLNENQELRITVDKLRNQLQEKSEPCEFLQEDSVFNRLIIMAQNKEVFVPSLYSLFIIEDIVIISLPEQSEKQLFFLININISVGRKRSLLIKETDLTPNRLPTLFRKVGAAFVCKRSDRREGELIADYISYKLRLAKVIVLPYLAGWSFTDNIPYFIDASNEIFKVLPENNFKLPSSSKWLIRSREQESSGIIEDYWNRLNLLSKPTSILISLFFHMSILQGILEKAGVWNLNKFLYIQVTDISIGCEKISQALLQVFNNDEPFYKTLDMPTKSILNSVLAMQDEILIVKADNPTSNQYKQEVRLDNFRILNSLCVNRDKFVINGQSFKSRATLAYISNQNIADLPMQDALSIYIGRKDLNIEELQKALQAPQIVGNYVTVLCQYISSNFDTVVKLLSEVAEDNLQIGLETFEENGIAYSIFMTVYKFLEKFLNHYNLKIEDLWGTQNDVEKLLVDFLYQNEVSNDTDSISEAFIEGFSTMITDCILTHRKSNDTLPGDGRINLFYDDNYLYITEQDLRENIMPDIFPFHITVNQLLKNLSAAEIITSDQSQVKTYLKTVYFPNSTTGKKQRKMVAINRNRIWSLGDDIL